MNLGEKLAALRKSAGLTQAQLGEQLNLSAQAISKWENNLAEPDISTLKKLSSIYNIPLAQLLEGDASGEEPTANGEPVAFRLRLVGLKNESTLAAVKALKDSTGCSLSDALDIVKNPGVIMYGSEAECKELGEKLDASPINTVCEPCMTDCQIGICTECNKSVNVSTAALAMGHLTCRSCQEKAKAFNRIQKEEAVRDTKKIFIFANVTAGIPALLWIILGFCVGVGENVFLGLLTIFGIAYALFACIFQLWYVGPVRWLFTRPARLHTGWLKICFADLAFLLIVNFILYAIGALVILLITVASALIGAALSLFLFPFSMRNRIKNLKERNTKDTGILDEIAV